MTSNPIFRRAVEVLEHIKDPTPPWGEILATARDLVGADSGSLIMMDGQGDLLNLNLVDVEDGAMRDYVQHFHKLDVLADASVGMSPGAWLDSNELFPPSKLSRTEFHADYLRKHNHAQILALLLEQNAERRTAFSFQRSTIKEGARDTLTTGEIATYIRTLQAALARRDEATRIRLQVLEESFGALAEAFFLVAASGQVFRLSPLARQILDNRHGLSLRQGKLWHPMDTVRGYLSARILATLRNGERSRASVPLAQGESLGLDIAVASQSLRLSNEPLAFVRLRRNSLMAEASPADFIATFGITPAEAKVLSGLVAGQSPAEFAMQNGVSENTVRKQIASLKIKMNCSRNVELVKLALMQR